MITRNYPFYPRLTSWGTLTQKQDFSLPQDSSIWLIPFPLTRAIWTILGQKDQDSPNLTKTISFDKNNTNHFGSKEPCQKHFTLPRHKKSTSPPQLRFLIQQRNSKKYDYDHSTMHLGYSSKSKQEWRYRENQKAPRKKQKPQILEERKNIKFFKELLFSWVVVFGMTNGRLLASLH